MPNITLLSLNELGFSRAPKLNVSIDFLPEEVGQNFFVKIGYLLTNRSIKPKEVGRGMFFEGTINPKTQKYKNVFVKDSPIQIPPGFVDLQFEIIIQPIHISKKYQII